MEEYEFGPFRLEVASRSLFRAGEFVPLPPKVAETLLLLVEEAGRVVTKEQLLERVWPGVVVEEGGIASNISALRKLLDDAFGEDGPIATVARRGYRFTAEVRKGVNERLAAQPAAPTAKPAPITDRDTILLADIENKTGDPVFDGTMKQALMLQLAQSPFLEVLTDRKVHSVLTSIDKVGAPLTGDLAHEVCHRTGCTAAITGSIFALGDEYVIGLQAVDASSGDLLASETARAKGKSEVLAALDRAVLGLRERLGESLASLKRHSLRFDEVGTSSLDAMKAYATARREWLIHGEMAAISYYERAIELDPQFCSAYSALALCLLNMGESARGREFIQKAIDFSDRGSERERARIQALYHQAVTGDLHKAMTAYRASAANYPRDTIPNGNMGHLGMLLGRWDKALQHTLTSTVQEMTVVGLSNLALILLALGRHDEARKELEKGFALGLDSFALHLDAYLEAFLRNDTEAMQRHVSAVLGRAGEEDFLIAAQADTEAYFGRFERARELTRRAVDSARKAGALEMAAMWEVGGALREVEFGNRELAAKGAAAALEASRGASVLCTVALAFARSGEIARARALQAEIEKEYPQDTQMQFYWLPCIRAALAIEAKDWKGAVDALEPAIALDFALCVPYENGLMYPAYLRGLAYLGLGRKAEAAAEFQKIVDRPGLIKNHVHLPLAQRQLSKI